MQSNRPANRKNKYATSFIAMYKMDMLNSATTASIPRSTLHYWQTSVSVNEYIGFPLDQTWDERKLVYASIDEIQYVFSAL